MWVSDLPVGFGWYWRCPDCAASDTGFVSEVNARAGYDRHREERHG